MATFPALQIYSPPQGLVPLTDDSWRRWLTEVVWPLVGQGVGSGVGSSGNQGTFPQLQVGKARWTRDNEAQELINLDQGIYITYYSAVQNFIYGFACNVHRSGGNAFVVGAQINAWGERGSTGDVYGIACTAIVAAYSTGPRNIIAFEPDVASSASANSGQKWGMNPVFKNRGDGAADPTEGTGSNMYNYAAYAMVITSQPRGTSPAFCGWNVGVEFLDPAMDRMLLTAWSSAVTYIPGDVTLSGGVPWKCVVANTNSSPTTVNTNWVQYGNATDGTNQVVSWVGIDMTATGLTSLSRMGSAIRLRNTMAIHWEETASIATYMDSANGRLVLAANWNPGGSSYVRQLQVDVSNGRLWVNNGIDALGAGAAATLGLISTVSGAGPLTAAQAGWYRFIDATTSTAFWVPAWR